MTSNTTNTNGNIPLNSNPIHMNPYDYVNKGINDITLEYFNLINPEQKRSIKSLFIGVGMLIGADIFKSILQNVIRDNQKSINNFLVSGLKLLYPNTFIFFWKFTKSIYFNIFNFTKKNIIRVNKKDDVTNNNINPIFYSIKCDMIFMKKLVLLIENYETNKNNYDKIKSLNYIEDCDNELEVLFNQTFMVKKLFNIKINYDDFNFQIEHFSYKLNLNSNNIDILNEKLSFHNIFSKKYEELNNIYNMKIDQNFSYWNKNIYSNTDKSTVIKKICENDNEIYSLSDYILYEIYKTEKTIQDPNTIMINIWILCNTLSLQYFINTESKLIRDIEQILKTDKNISDFTEDYDIHHTISHELNKISLKKQELNTFINHFYLLIKPEKKTSNEYLLNFEINSDFKYEKKIINKKIIDFIGYVDLMSKKHKINKNINIYTINTETKIIIDKTDNPQYVSYMETKKKLLDEKKTLEDIIKLIGIEPEKYILNEKKNYEVVKKTVNTKYCSFENLYLRKQQDTILFNLTDRFINDKKIMEHLGIPNKLGILLYGEPGCGKTTTIITLSSYLGRDIFYLNLKSIKTNEELKMIFDYVNAEHSGGGVIVLEDIDAMTNIVMKRNQSLNNNVLCGTNNLIESNEDNITFEYLLNLLDGTLTYNDSVVIITTNHLENLDPALYRSGRIDNLIEIKKCDHYQISKIYKRFIQRDIDPKILNKIPENTITPAKIIFHLVDWIKKRDEDDSIIMNDFIN